MRSAMTLWQRFQIWRLRPGLVFARKLAEQQAWKHPNANMLGPELNLMSFAREIGYRLTDADQHGKIDGLCLDATTSPARVRFDQQRARGLVAGTEPPDW